MNWLLVALLLTPSFAGKKRVVKRDEAPDGFQELVVRAVLPRPGGAVVILTDEDEEKVLHMVVGQSEGQTIFFRLERRAFERPLTHDLFDQVLGFAQTRVVDVRIDDVRADTFVARVTVETKKRKRHTLDARASDSIAMALGRGLPIYFADHVVEQMAMDPGELLKQPDDHEPDVDDPHDAL